jgi:steroid 5-alpha reductase family enzyme
MFYDLTGSFTYLSTVAIALGTNSNINFIQGIAAGMIAIWALRLGIYLFKRVLQKGFDSRFYEMK